MILLTLAGISFGLIALTWLVYPMAMWVRGRGSDPGPAASGHRDRVVVVVATRDEPAAALARTRNLLDSTYPASLLNIIIAVDRAAPFALDAYRAALGGLAEVVPGDEPGGKAANLNAGVRAASAADILVFADVGQEFNREAISRMVGALQDERFGGVAGRYTQHLDDAVMSAYAGLESVIRSGQARSHSVVSTSGSIYAIRARLWRPLPAGLICDDLFTTLSIVRQGHRVGFCRDAIAYDPRTFTRDEQFARRVRTLTGLIQYATLEPRSLWPWSNPIWMHFVLHKVLRLLTPIPLLIGVLALGSWLALRAPLILVMAALVGIAVAIAVRVAAPAVFTRVARQALWVLRLQLVPGAAIANGLRGRWTVWTPTPQGTGSRAGAGL